MWGQQLLNVVLGGSLFQDINDQISTDIEHEQKNPRNEGSHKIKIFENTKLYSIVNTKQMFVNSAHHQSVKKLGKDLLVNAHARMALLKVLNIKAINSV